jgi:hypothetical protein
MKLKNILLGAAMMVALTVGNTAQAAKIEYCVETGGKLALIVPSSNLGGRVQYSRAHGMHITDRASRGERVIAYMIPSTRAEKANPYVTSTWLSSTAGASPLRSAGPNMVTYVSFEAPLSPHADNVHVNVCTVSGTFKERLPIGSRPTR